MAVLLKSYECIADAAETLDRLRIPQEGVAGEFQLVHIAMYGDIGDGGVFDAGNFYPQSVSFTQYGLDYGIDSGQRICSALFGRVVGQFDEGYYDFDVEPQSSTLIARVSIYVFTGFDPATPVQDGNARFYTYNYNSIIDPLTTTSTAYVATGFTGVPPDPESVPSGYTVVASPVDGNIEGRLASISNAPAGTYDPNTWGYHSSRSFTFHVALNDNSAPDTTPPSLSSPSATATGANTADLSVTTDESNGTAYAVVTTSATAPSPSQIMQGQDDIGSTAAWSGSQAVSATGAISFTATGLAGSTTYYAHFVHDDASGNASTVASSNSFTTLASTLSPADAAQSHVADQAIIQSSLVDMWPVDATHLHVADTSSIVDPNATTPFTNFPAADWSDTQGSTSGAFTDSSTINDSEDVTFGFLEVQIPASPVGILIEAGATGDGMGLAFDGAGQLVGAAGKGNTTSTDNDTVFVSVDSTPMHGKTVDIYWCLRPTAVGRGKIYVYEHGTATLLAWGYTDIPDGSKMGTQDAEGDWTGGNNYGVGVDNVVRSGISTAHFNGTMTQGAVAWANRLPADFDDNVEPTPATSDVVSADAVHTHLADTPSVSVPSVSTIYDFEISNPLNGGDTTRFVRDVAAAKNGSYGITAHDTGNYTTAWISSESHSRGPDFKLSGWVRADNAGGHEFKGPGFCFGHQGTSDNAYQVGIDARSGGLLYARTDFDYTNEDTSAISGFALDTWYWLEVTWSNASVITGTLYDTPGGTQIGQVTRTDNKYTSGYVGLAVYSDGSFDDLTIGAGQQITTFDLFPTDTQHDHVSDQSAITGVYPIQPSDATHTHAADASAVTPSIKVLPNNDVSAGGWIPDSGSDLYSRIASDTGHIRSPSFPLGQAVTVALESVLDPETGLGHIISYTARAQGSIDLTVSLLDGASVVASWTQTLSASDQTYTYELNEAEANAISDYANLRLRFEAVGAA